MDSIRRKLYFLISVVAALALAGPAQATFPGVNGKIAVERGNETAESDIYVVDPDGTDEVNLTHNGGNNRVIAWSPDGSRVAFRSDGDGSDNYYDIFVAPADGSGPVRLTYLENAGNPAWSPDGASITFVNDYLYTIGADGTGLRRLSDLVRAEAPVWSPDGRKIVFKVDTVTRWDLYVVNRDGSGLRRLTDDADEFPAWPSFSPDGTRIVYATNRDPACTAYDCYTLYVMDADGTHERKLTEGPVFYATWAPDGSRIAFSSSRGYEFDVYTIAPDGTGEQRLTYTAASESPPQWSPDSTQLVFTRNNSVYVMNRDGTGERFLTFGGGQQWQSLPDKHAKRRCKAKKHRLRCKAR